MRAAAKQAIKWYYEVIPTKVGVAGVPLGFGIGLYWGVSDAKSYRDIIWPVPLKITLAACVMPTVLNVAAIALPVVPAMWVAGAAGFYLKQRSRSPPPSLHPPGCGDTLAITTLTPIQK